MSQEKNIEDDYNINLKIDKELFKYNSVKKTSILLKRHYELPQNYKFTSPKLSKNGHYLSIIGKARNEKDDDVVFIYNANHLKENPILKFYGTSKIEVFTFSPDESNFVVIYVNKPPSFYDFKETKVLAQGEIIKPDDKKVLSYSYSKKGNKFAVGTDKDFIIYNAHTGKIYVQIVDNSKIKIYRGKILVLIDDSFKIKVYEILKWSKDPEEKIEDVQTYFDNRIKLIKEFQYTAFESIDNIITSKLSQEKDYIYFISNYGIYRIKIESQEMDQISIIEGNIKEGVISDNCNLFMTTDMETIKFWDFEHSQQNSKDIGYIYKEKFNSFSINFSQYKLLTSDDLCIDITDILDKTIPQEYIWLDLNPTEFTSFSFSPDYKVILAIIDEHLAIAYNTSEGYVIKKWKNNLDNWARACQMVPETSYIGVIATKSYNKIIKLWDYLTGSDLATFRDFDVHNFCFSKKGNILAAGTTEGEEIARAWNLKDGAEYKFYFRESENEIKNKNTFIKIHYDNSKDNNNNDSKEDKIENLKLIAVSEEQNPLIFNFQDQQLILECTGCPITLKYIKDVQSQELFNLFYIYGVCINNIPTAIIFDLNGEMIGEFENCKNIEFNEVSKCVLNYSDDIKQNILTINHIDDQNNFETIECETSEVNAKFLSDGKSIVCIKDEGENKKTIFFNEVNNGEIIGEIEFEKKTKNFVTMYLSLDKKDNSIIFRFIELINQKQNK